MSKPVKDMIASELSGRYSTLESALWVEMVGVDGLTNNQFRRALNDRKMRLEIVKTSLFRRAVNGKPLSRLAESMNGPSAVITGGESVIDVAKLVEEWAPKIPKLKMRGALLEGEYLDESRVGTLAKMPNRAELLSMISGQALAPAGKLAAAINSGGARIAGCVKSLIEKLEKGEAAA
ncbi:MAG: 50S ribosomal protein L10 [Phycisphaerales bacterium]|nr:50S ribosomal protein L10 [Phycisphaerales bacterium]